MLGAAQLHYTQGSGGHSALTCPESSNLPAAGVGGRVWGRLAAAHLRQGHPLLPGWLPAACHVAPRHVPPLRQVRLLHCLPPVSACSSSPGAAGGRGCSFLAQHACSLPQHEMGSCWSQPLLSACSKPPALPHPEHGQLGVCRPCHKRLEPEAWGAAEVWRPGGDSEDHYCRVCGSVGPQADCSDPALSGGFFGLVYCSRPGCGRGYCKG